MALADTARLIASLELQDKFTPTARRAEGSIGSLDRKMSTLGRSGQQLGAGLGRAASSLARLGVGVAAAGVGALAVNIRAGIASLNELQSVTTATATVIASTGGVAGQSAADIRALSEEYETLNATMDDKVIQTGANLLLTFTNIRTDAFEPALEAALNLNEAMGGGEAGLESTIIQVGKALNDPIAGIGALRRVGVQLTAQQEGQIRTLIEQNDLYGAQQVILDELGTQFGGRFAAAGDTAQGRMAALGDTIEDLQQRLAGPLLPAIDRVREKLIDLLSSRQAQRSARELGEAIAGIFTNRNIERGAEFLQDTLGDIRRLARGGGREGSTLSNISGSIGTIAAEISNLPWTAIGDAARLLGTGSKALLDAFLGLPPWVQTAVLTGWGLNKLTGGALTGIVGTLASGLVRGILGINAGVVKLTAGTVIGGGGGLGGGPGVPGGPAAPAGPRAPSTGLGGVVNAGLLSFPDQAPMTETTARRIVELNESRIERGVGGLVGEGLISQAQWDEALTLLGTIGDNTKTGPRPGTTSGGIVWRRGERQLTTLGSHTKDTRDYTRRTSERVGSLPDTATLVPAVQDVSRDVETTGSRSAGILRNIEHVEGTSSGHLSTIKGTGTTSSAHLSSIRDSERTNSAHLADIKAKKQSVSVTVVNNNSIGVSFSSSQAAIELRRITQTTENYQDFEVVD